MSFGDVQKRRAWEARLARYRSSGLSVVRFCAQEQVSTHTFYYWVKRLRAASRRAAAHQPPFSPAQQSEPAPADNNTPAAVVRFRLQTGAEVLVPANHIDVIRCLAECLTAAGGQRAFQEVVVKA